MWLLWGTGSLNAAVLPATLLATSTTYELPPLVRAVANQAEQVWDGRQVYRGRLRGDHDLLDRHYESDLRIHRTPEVMLASVQDYRAGLPGLQEHVWGVTLGPETQLFATGTTKCLPWSETNARVPSGDNCISSAAGGLLPGPDPVTRSSVRRS